LLGASLFIKIATNLLLFLTASTMMLTKDQIEKTMTHLVLLLIIGFAPLAKAESALPDCPADQSAVFDNCFGTFFWLDGTKYIGEYKDGKNHGQGTFTLPDGRKYIGEFKDDKYHGQGTFTLPGGQKYVGEWKDNKKNGQGTFTWLDGTKYVGEFKDDKYHGQGTFTLPGGQKYVGEWKGNKKNGQGTFTFPSGQKLSGYFMNDEYVPNICRDMGLTQGTPEHGKCVLKLMDSVMSEDD
jgi:hypothetical protein